jgi:hypothetical protein
VKAAELQEEIAIELEAIQIVVAELAALLNDTADREPTLREKTAGAAFLAQFYNGVENILKRISLFHDQPLPTGEMWHLDLFQRFSEPAQPPLPLLFDEEFAPIIAPYRRFRHVVLHSYGFQIEWSRMRHGIDDIDGVFSRLRDRLQQYMRTLDS